MALLNRFGYGCRHFGAVRLDLRQGDFRVHQEHAAVPEMAARGHESAGTLGIRLFDEGLNGLNARLAGNCQLDVAVARFHTGRHDAKRHHRAALARFLCGLDRRGKALGILDPVVGGQHQQLRASSLGNGQMGGQRNGWRGVAALWLQGDALPRQLQRSELFSDQKAVGLVADDNRRSAGDPRRPQHGALQQGAFVEQGMKGLGEQRPRQRPQTAANAAGQHHGYEGLQVGSRLGKEARGKPNGAGGISVEPVRQGSAAILALALTG